MLFRAVPYDAMKFPALPGGTKYSIQFSEGELAEKRLPAAAVSPIRHYEELFAETFLSWVCTP